MAETMLGIRRRGKIQVEIEGVGSLGWGGHPDQIPCSLQLILGHVYVVLTGRSIFDEGDMFEIIEYNPDQGTLKAKIRD